MKALTLLTARVAEMSAEDAAAAVGAEALAAVRREDDRPMFVELIAAHEGVSTGSLTGGSLTGALSGRGRPAQKFWSRERVSELVDRLVPGVPVFTGHGGAGRRPVGKMLAAAGRMVSGALAAAGIAWVSDPRTKERLRAGELDTCSIEAEVELHRAPGEESWVVGAVRRVTGVALGDRRRERPGFPGAAVLRVIEEFEDGEGERGVESGKGEKELKGEEGEAAASSPAAPTPPDGNLAAELRAIRAELRELREALKRAGGDRRDPRPRPPAPPERERPSVNPLIPR
jgi:hypothetical protein